VNSVTTREIAAGIVVVDDDDDNRRFVTTVLERAGHAVRSYANPVEALDHLRAHPASVVISDMRMPDVSGIEFARAVLGRHPRTAIVLMTAYANLDDAIEALRLGVDDFLQKPLSVDTLVDKVDALMTAATTLVAQRILAVGAHPDDVEIGIGGILAAHRAAGADITIYTLTNGEAGGDEQTRELESIAAARVLGATVRFGRFDDTRLGHESGLVQAIEDVVQEMRPDLVYTHGSSDLHQDHAAVHHATMVATRRVDRVYGYQSPSSTVEFAPRRFIPIDDHLTTKLESIACYRSQTEVRDYLEHDLLVATARYWGRFTNARYAEPVEVIAERGELSSSAIVHNSALTVAPPTLVKVAS
jgi:LmbE family N-acetylglucosaminyl deacetylase